MNLKNIIFNESCLETLEKLKKLKQEQETGKNPINLVITSPPYNMNLRIRNGKYCSRQIVKEFSTKYEGFDDNLPIDEFYEFHSQVIKDLLEVSDMIFYNIQIVTGSKRAFFKIIGEFNENLKEIIVWDKNHGQPAMQSGVLNRQSELLLVFEKKENAISRQFKNAQFDRGTLSDIWNIKRKPLKETKGHSAVFPEKLVETILKNFSNEGDVIYDPFMGTGTTAVVSKKMNRNYIGSEINQKYIDICNQRLEKA